MIELCDDFNNRAYIFQWPIERAFYMKNDQIFNLKYISSTWDD